MKISLEKKILLGFVINLLVVIALGSIFTMRLNKLRNQAMDSTLDFIELSLFILSVILLIIVYFVIRFQLRSKIISQGMLIQNEQLLQSILDNTSNPVYVKKITGEYILINKKCESLFQLSKDKIIGKTDYDFLPESLADAFRNSDWEVVKKRKESRREQVLQQSDGPHTLLELKFPLYDPQGTIYAIGGISTDITEIKEMEASLIPSDEFFNMSSDMMIISSKDNIIKVNPAVIKILGYSETELLSRPLSDFIVPEDHDITQKELTKVQSGNLTINFENRWLCKNGAVKWLQWSASANAPKALIYGVGRDITRQKEIEKSLAASDQFFKMSYDIFVVAEGDYFVKINPAYTRILGRTQEDMNKTPFMIFAHPDDAKATLEALSKLRSGVPMVSYRARAQAKDGSYKWLDWTATVDLQSGTLYGIARDVTQLIEDETSLKMANKFFNMAFDMLTIVKNKRFIKINPAFTKLLGYEQKDLDNIIFTDLTHPDDKEITDQVLARLMNGETVANFQNRLHNKDGTYKWFDWKGNFDVEQGILYSVARDITEKVLMETEQQLVTKLLHENEERLRLVIENISEGVIVANPEREVVMSNDMANIILGIEANEKIPFDLTDRFELFLPDEKTVFPAQNLPMERALAGQETNDLDLIIRNSYQKKRVLISGRPLVDNEKNIVAAVITIKDISNYKQLEEELKEYRQLIGYKASEKA